MWSTLFSESRNRDNIASQNEVRFLDDFYAALIAEMKLTGPLGRETLPCGVTCHSRSNGRDEFVFVQNFTREPRTLRGGEGLCDALTGRPVSEACP